VSRGARPTTQSAAREVKAKSQSRPGDVRPSGQTASPARLVRPQPWSASLGTSRWSRIGGQRARLSSLSSVRPADVTVAEAEIRAAEADADEGEPSSKGKCPRSLRRKGLAILRLPRQSVRPTGIARLRPGPRNVLSTRRSWRRTSTGSCWTDRLDHGRCGCEGGCGHGGEIGYLVGYPAKFQGGSGLPSRIPASCT